MKKQFLTGTIAAAGLFFATGLLSCSDNYVPSTDTDGSIIVSVDLNKEVLASKAAAPAKAPDSRADAKAVSAADLQLKLSSLTGDFQRDLGTVASFNAPVEVPVGKHTLEATYGDISREGYDLPYYYGSAPVEVFENKTTTVSCTAMLGNSMVRAEFSEAFKAYFTSYSLSFHSTLGNEIAFDREGESIYMNPGAITGTIEIVKPNGTRATLQPVSFTAEPRHSYLLQFDYNSGEIGDGVLTITYDDTLAQEEVVIDLSDAILNAPAPRLQAEGFTDGEALTILDGETPAAKPRITAIAQGGVQSVILTTSSVYLESQGWPKEIDLVSGDASTLARMQALGLRMGGMERPERMAVVDFAGLLSKIPHLEGADNTSTFSVQVRDKNSKVAEKPVGFSVTVNPLSLSVNRVAPLEDYATTCEMYVNFNGTDISGIKVETSNERGTWDVTPCTAAAAPGEEGVYLLTFTVPSTEADIPVRLSIGSKTLLVTVKHSPNPYSLSLMADGAFGWQAGVQVVYTAPANSARRHARSAETPDNVTFELSADNGKTWTAAASAKLAEANRYLVKGLTSGKSYTLRATCDGVKSKALSFTTETGEQLPNANMDTWYRTDGIKGVSGVFWWHYYPAASAEGGAWSTMNPLTTSFTGTRDYTAYCNFSGTHETDDARSGKAAAIETVGWGANAAQAWWTDSKNITVGQLYLGSYNSSTQAPDYGYAFTARPRSVEFWYHYRAKNSADFGRAWVKVLDASGNVLATAQLDLPAVESYTRQALDLENLYAAPFAKAASLQLTFLSSGYEGVESQNNSDWLDRPAFANLTDGRFTGSSLYIDDITLNY